MLGKISTLLFILLRGHGICLALANIRRLCIFSEKRRLIDSQSRCLISYRLYTGFLASQKCGNAPKLNQDVTKYCLEGIALPTASAYAPIGMHDTQSLDSQSSCSPPHRLLAPAAQRTAMQQGSIRFNLCLEVAVLPWSSAAQEPRILSLAGRCVKEGPISAFKKVVGWLQNLITASIA